MGMEIKRKMGKGTEHFHLLPWDQVASNSPGHIWRNQIIFLFLWICKGKRRDTVCCWLRIAQGAHLPFQHKLWESNGNPVRLKDTAKDDCMGFGGTWQRVELGMKLIQVWWAWPPLPSDKWVHSPGGGQVLLEWAASSHKCRRMASLTWGSGLYLLCLFNVQISLVGCCKFSSSRF